MGRIRVAIGENTVYLPPAGGHIGRPNPVENWDPEINLHPNTTVSRRHARVWYADGAIQIQDVGSRHGTYLHDQHTGEERLPINAARALPDGMTVRFGDQIARIEWEPDPADHVPAHPVPAPEPQEVAPVKPTPAAPTSPGGEVALLLRVAAHLSGDAQREERLEGALAEIFRSRKQARLAALLREARDALVIMALYPPDVPDTPSLTRAQEVMRSRRMHMWAQQPHGMSDSPAMSTARGGSGLYVPLLWDGAPLGVLCVESGAADAFLESDRDLFDLLAFQLSAVRAEEVAAAGIREREEVLENFGRLVSRPVGAEVRAHQGILEPRMLREEVAVLFSDIRGFTKMAARMTPEQVTQMIRDYLTPLTAAIEDHAGIVDKFMGDGIMALFVRGDDEGEAGHVVRAVSAGLTMQQEATAVSRRRTSAGLAPGHIGIGIHCGRALVGFSGATSRMEYTAIGDAVNVASRFCDGAAANEVLVSEDVHHLVRMNLRHEAGFERRHFKTKDGVEREGYRVVPRTLSEMH